MGKLGGLVTLGSHAVKSWSSTQAVVALSSGEADYYGLVKVGTMALGIRSMLQDMGIDGRIVLRTDASAAKGIGDGAWMFAVAPRNGNADGGLSSLWHVGPFLCPDLRNFMITMLKRRLGLQRQPIATHWP